MDCREESRLLQVRVRSSRPSPMLLKNSVPVMGARALASYGPSRRSACTT